MKTVLVSLVAQCVLVAQARAADWPEYQGDAARSGVSTETIKLPLKVNWVYKLPTPPRPAWEEPGKEAHRLDFDFSPQPIIAGGRVFFCSSGDDTVRAADLVSGGLRWQFTAGGPVRFAPAIADGRLYVACDDGWLYCLGAEKGNLLWRFRAALRDDMVLGNGRMISRWPMRSGAVVVDGVVYTAAGMWPNEGVHIYALDAKTGKVIWRNDSTGIQYVELPHPGATGFSGVAPQGYLAVAGDVLLVPTGRSCPAAFDRRTGKFLYCWPHRSWDDAKRGGCWLTTGGGLYFNPTREPKGTSESFVGEASPLPNDGMVAYDVKTNKPVFELKGKNRVLVAGNVLYAIGNGEAAAYDLAALRAKKKPDTAVKWKSPHLRVYGMALVGNTLFVGGKGVLSALDAKTGKRVWYQTIDIPGPIRGIAAAGGCVVVATDHGVLSCFSRNGRSRPISEAPDWRIKIPAKAMAVADETVRRSGKVEGYALVIGDNNSEIAAALAMRSGLHVIQAVTGEDRAAAERSKLMHTDLYGTRVAVVGTKDPTRLPFAPYFADVILVTGKGAGLSGRELYRVLRPCGGIMLFDSGVDAGVLVGRTGAQADEIAKDDKGRTIVVRGALPGAGEWRHQWADGGKSGIGLESRLTAPLELLWFGGPGPDRMMDRHYGSSPPLSVDGRVFVTGEHHLIAFDAYNGRELWCLGMRGVGRKWTMRTSANIVADDDMIYVVVGSVCHRISQATGERLASYPLPTEVSGAASGWDYVDLAGDLILGHCRRTSAVFALDKAAGTLRWSWRPAHQVHESSIAHGDRRVYCLDVEPDDAKARRRGLGKGLARSLVALNLSDGSVAWRRDNVPKTRADRVQFANGVVTVYANATYDATNGKQLWRKPTVPDRPPLILWDWIIAQPHAYNIRTGEQRMTTDPATGTKRPWEYIQSYGCGGVAGCQSMLFFRSALPGFYDFKSDGTTTFGGVRVGCSINLIAANGLAIMPETSSGCACSYNFQTSLALVPASDRKQAQTPWFVFSGRRSTGPLARASLNFGAPGDRLDGDGVRWLGMPRPILGGAVPVDMKVSSKAADFHRHPRWEDLAGVDKPWLYGSCVRNPGRITVDLIGHRPHVAAMSEQPLVIDGKLDKSLVDAGGKGRIHIGFSNRLKRRGTLYLRYDKENLYLAARCVDTSGAKSKSTWVGKCKGQDARVWEDDSWEFYISDGARRACVHLGVSASGARFDGLWDCTAYDVLRGLNRDWDGAWKSAASIDGKTWTAEVAIPFDVLAKAGIDKDGLCLNALCTGPGSLGSPDYLSVEPDRFCVRWRGFIEAPASETYTFVVQADDRAQLRIGDKTIIRHDCKKGQAGTKATIPMRAGERVPIEMLLEEVGGLAAAKLAWSSQSTPNGIVPSSALFTADGKQGGLSAEYSNRWFEKPILKRVDATIDFMWKGVDLKKVPRAELCRSGSIRPRLSGAFAPVWLGKRTFKKAYTVRLHFAELDDVKPGRRVFDVKIQDKQVLTGFDIAKEAKGTGKPVVKAFSGIACGDDARIAVDLIPRDNGTARDVVPVLSGLEIVAE